MFNPQLTNLDAMNALNWNQLNNSINSTSVSLLSGTGNLQFKINEFNRLQLRNDNQIENQFKNKSINQQQIINTQQNQFQNQSFFQINNKPEMLKSTSILNCNEQFRDEERKIKKSIKKKISKSKLDKTLSSSKQSHITIRIQATKINDLQTKDDKQTKINDVQINDSQLKDDNQTNQFSQINKEQHQTKFSWKKYLDETNSIAAPLNCFKANQTFNKRPNYFKPDFKLETVDPQHPSLFCVASVVELCGFRMRIHLDKYSSQFDFWVNCDSPFIFHVGFCAKTNRKLQPPKNYFDLDKFDWTTYLQQEKAKSAPKHCFYWYNKQLQSLISGFKQGMKLEAVDKANSSLVCVATINDIIGDWLLIHFDGWDNGFDYWAQVDSPYIHPINWCKSKGKALTPPKDYPKSSDKFSWLEYLEETSSLAVPSSSFRVRAANVFKTSMKLEVVDPKNSRYMRVATIISRNAYSIKLNFDNWNEKFNFWLDDDSPDLHPINWCLQANNNYLEGPALNEQSSRDRNACPFSICKGIGHLNPNNFNHNSLKDCPYSEENFKRLLDRLKRIETKSINTKSDEAIDDDINNLINSNLNSSIKDKNSTSKMNISRKASSTSNNNEIAINSNETTEEDLAKQLSSFVNSFNPKEILLEWDCFKVSDFVSVLLECKEYSSKFKDEQIDGESFLLLNENDLIYMLGIKLYSAHKIYNAICQIKSNLLK